MEFRLLGPIEAHDGGRHLDLGHAKQQCVLAVLLLEAGQVVSSSTLIDRVWGHEPPNGAPGGLYAYVTRLRKALAPVGVRLPRKSGGYLVDVSPDTVDVHRFRYLVGEARLDEALELWRGTPFATAPSPWLAEVRGVLEQQYLSAVVERNDVYLAGGRHAELIDALRELAVAHPLDERVAGQVMTALYRSGRAPEALDSYRTTRQRLATARGTEPGPALRRLHQRILRGDSDLAPGTASALLVPAGLPHDIAGFVGRYAELAELDRLIPATNSRRPVVISTLHGTAGVGKTALAVHWAHRVKDRFPDGCLYADLHGYGPGAPADPADVLHDFLTVLGVAPARVPSDVDGRATLYRSLLDERRMLILLDNASTAAQVRPLLPGSSTCVVLVTSRSMLNGLVARDRARSVSLDVLPLDEAVALLAEFAGQPRITAEPEAARQLAALCARLPVALCVAGVRAAGQPDIALAKLVADLDADDRLDLLDAGGDVDTAVRAVFSWSFADLPADAARLFRLIGLHPGNDLDAFAAAALAGCAPARAARLFDTLVHSHLVQLAAPRRYRMHDLLRVYAAECAVRQEPEPVRRAALTRLADLYVASTAAAVHTLYPHDRQRLPEVTVPLDLAVPPLDESAAAQAWLDTERANLLAVAAHAPDHVVTLAALLRRYLHVGGHYSDALELHGNAARAARAHGDRVGEATALHNLGQIHQAAGHNDEALDRYERALEIFTQVGDRRSVARALFQLGTVQRECGRHAEANDHLDRAGVIFREIGDRLGEGNVLAAIGEVLARSGEYALARDRLDLAAAIFAELDYHQGGGAVLGALGDLYSSWGRRDEARAHYERALAVADDVGDRRMRARTLNGLADISRAEGDHSGATGDYRAALALAREVGALEEEARALAGIAEILAGTGRRSAARQHWREALAIYAAHGFPEADTVRDLLAST